MHELNCPSCNAAASYETTDYVHMCPVCSTSFVVRYDQGIKEVFNDHFIVPNQAEPSKVKDTMIEWLRRLHHKPAQAKMTLQFPKYLAFRYHFGWYLLRFTHVGKAM